MKAFRAVLLVILLSSITSGVRAQSREFGAAAMSGPGGVLVLIANDALHPGTAAANKGWIGYSVYRKAEGESDFRPLTPKPLSRAGTLEDFTTRTGIKADFLGVMLNVADPKEVWNRIVKNDKKTMLLAMLDPGLREALGLLYRDGSVKAGTRYTYAIARVAADGRESERVVTDPVTAGVPQFILKGPLGLASEVGEQRVALRWQRNPADTGALGYFVYRGYEKNGRFARLNDRPIVLFEQKGSKKSSEGAYTDTTVLPGRTLFYAVVSADYAGNESPRAPLLEVEPRDTTAPGIPEAVTARPSGNGITVTWNTVHDADLAGYAIYRAPKSDSRFELLTDALLPPDTGIYEDTRAVTGTQYFYRVHSVDRAGNVSLPSANGLATYSNFKPPMPPQGVVAEPKDNGIFIAWALNEEPDIQGYLVYRSESLNGEFVQVSPLITKDTTFYHDRDPHITSKGAYWYHVQAVAYSGAVSPFSAPHISSPMAMEGPAAAAGIRGYQDVIGNRMFWIPSNDNTVEGWMVYRAVEEKSLRWEALLKVALPGDVVTFTDSAAVTGVSYVYRVKAVNAAGIEGPPSQSLVLSKFAAPPLPPGGIMATRAANGIRVGWDRSHESGVKGYVVYRKDGKGSPKPLNPSPLAADATSFEDRTAKAGEYYLYSVAAVSADGREGFASDAVLVTPR